VKKIKNFFTDFFPRNSLNYGKPPHLRPIERPIPDFAIKRHYVAISEGDLNMV
jgi:hypothetical protein